MVNKDYFTLIYSLNFYYLNIFFFSKKHYT